MRTLLLPGLDGTGLLFARLTRALPEDLGPVVIRYPTAEALTYDELVDKVVVPDGDVAIVAESFSGPIGVKLAARLGSRVRALVLVATFARRPSWLVTPASFLATMLFRLQLPRAAARALLLEAAASKEEVDELRQVLRQVSPAVLAQRLREIDRVDVTAELGSVRSPLLYLRASRDRLIHASTVAAFREVAPAIEVATIDAPHLLLQRRPEECGRLIAAFIRSHC